MSEPVLAEHDWSSAVWQKLKRHYEARLTELRAMNDNTMTEAQTIKLRAEIGEVKRLLLLGTPPRKPLKHDPMD